MKKFILLFLLFITFSLSAQFGNRNNRNNQRRNPIQNTHVDKKKEFEFSTNRYLGIVIYDAEKAAKKIGAKSKSKEVVSLISNFNKSLKEVIRINTFTFSEMKNYVESTAKIAKKTGDYSESQKVQKTLKERLKPFADILEEREKKLDTSLEEILSEKQFKKWKKYKKKAKRSIN